MTDSLLTLLGGLYATGAAITVTYLIVRAPRWALRWLSVNRPRTVEDWVFAPVIAMAAVGLAFVTYVAAAFLWPAVAGVIFEEKRRVRGERRLRDAQEEEALFLEGRNAREGGAGLKWL